MKRIIAVGFLLGVTGCSFAGPYVTNISLAGDQGILVEKCKVQYNSLTAKVSTESCNTSYVWLGNEAKGKAGSEEGANPNNNVITIK